MSVAKKIGTYIGSDHILKSQDTYRIKRVLRKQHGVRLRRVMPVS